MRKPTELPVQPVMCATCPFREGSDTAWLKDYLAKSAATEASRICHSPGSNNAFHRRTGKPAAVCRGARDLQLQMFHRLGFLKEPTDACWAAKVKELKL